MFEATKDVLRSHIPNKDRQYNGKEKRENESENRWYRNMTQRLYD
jgi:hypothetical protein